MLDLWNKALFAGLHGGDPFLAQIRLRVQREGNSAFLGGGEMEYKRCSVQFSYPTRDAQGMTVDEFFGKAVKLGADMAREQMKGVIDKIMTPSPHTMPLKIEGSLTFDQILDTWAKMEVRFDQDGTPIWPQIMLSPEWTAKLHEQMPKWLQDPNCQEKMAVLAKQKRKEFDEREARRRLVD